MPSQPHLQWQQRGFPVTVAAPLGICTRFPILHPKGAAPLKRDEVVLARPVFPRREEKSSFWVAVLCRSGALPRAAEPPAASLYSSSLNSMRTVTGGGTAPSRSHSGAT